MPDDDPTLSPLGALLEQHRGSVSKREAARRAGISEGRWRQIVTGQQKAGAGVVVPANPRRETVIAMAAAVGANVNEALRLAGMEPQKSDQDAMHRSSGSDVYSDEVARAILASPLMDDAKQHLLKQYQMLAELSDFVSKKADEEQASPAREEGRAERPLRAVARKRPPRSDRP